MRLSSNNPGFQGHLVRGHHRQGVSSVKSFTLIELLVVVAIIAILLALLLPALGAARRIARQVVCADTLHGLGQGMYTYSESYHGWVPGSPNTSGNGANPGGVGRSVYGGYYHWDPDTDAWPAIHIFDWASPLLAMMASVPTEIPDRYDQSKRWAFKCPANNWLAKVNHVSRINIMTLVSSYATCRYFTYVPLSQQTGTEPGGLFWSHPFVPRDYLPKLSRIENPTAKVFLADACKIDRGNPQRISNQDYGYSTHGAWLDEADVENDSPSLSYRFSSARTEAFRHGNGINMLFFDGHVEHHAQGSSDDKNGYGSGARQALFWFPSGTDTRELPNNSKLTNTDLIVP